MRLQRARRGECPAVYELVGGCGKRKRRLARKRVREEAEGEEAGFTRETHVNHRTTGRARRQPPVVLLLQRRALRSLPCRRGLASASRRSPRRSPNAAAAPCPAARGRARAAAPSSGASPS